MKKTLFYILFLCIWELYRENNYLEKAYPKVVFTFDNYLNELGTLNVQGNQITKDFENGEYSSPRMSYYSCKLADKTCIESTAYQFSNIWIIDSFILDIVLYSENELIAVRETSSMKEEVRFNLKTKEALINQIMKNSKTGDKFKDISNHTTLTKLVDSTEIFQKGKDFKIDFWNTPIYKVVYTFKKQFVRYYYLWL